MYVQPAQVMVRNSPQKVTKPGSLVFWFRDSRYQKPTRANLGPEVTAMKIWKADRSGYRSPMVAETEGNHSCG